MRGDESDARLLGHLGREIQRGMGRHRELLGQLVRGCEGVLGYRLTAEGGLGRAEVTFSTAILSAGVLNCHVVVLSGASVAPARDAIPVSCSANVSDGG